MKKYLITILFFLIPFIGFGQNCPSSAELIDACGTSFTTSNSGNDNSCACTDTICICYSPQFGGYFYECPSCPLNTVGVSYPHKNIDCNINTGNGDGADVGYSVENDLYYKFCPQTTGTWDIELTGYNCDNSDGWQYAVFQGNKDSLHTLLAGGTNGMDSTGTVNISVNVTQTSECYFLQIDGYAGNACDFDVTLTAPSGACVLPIELLSFNVTNKDGVNVITWETASETNSSHFILERMNAKTGDWEPIERKEAAGTTPNGRDYYYKDYTYEKGTNYYRLTQVDYNGEKEEYGPIVINNEHNSMNPIRVINYLGQEVSEDYQGMKIYVYPDGTTEKKVESNQN